MSTFQNAIAFFVNLGVYDVVLPFLLVFVLIFAMLEKTRVLGSEKNKETGDMVTKKNLNSMVAFVTGFLVIASSELVRVVNEVMANTVLLLLLSVLFLMLAGSFHKDEEFFLKEGMWRTMFMVIMFVGIILIFLNALGWLEMAWRYTVTHIEGPVVGSFAMLVVVMLAMWGIVREPKSSGGNSENS